MSIYIHNCGHSDDTGRRTKHPDTCAARCIQPKEPYVDCQSRAQLRQRAANKALLLDRWTKAKKLGLKRLGA